MTPRKELFIKIKEALLTVPELDLVDLQRGQMDKPKENYPSYMTACFIAIKAIKWGAMTNNIQEGKCAVEVTFHCKDGWMDQHDGTTDPEHGLQEIDLIDDIHEKLCYLKGDYFTPLQPDSEDDDDLQGAMMSYRLTFTTTLYKQLPSKYTNYSRT